MDPSSKAFLFDWCADLQARSAEQEAYNADLDARCATLRARSDAARAQAMRAARVAKEVAASALGHGRGSEVR